MNSRDAATLLMVMEDSLKAAILKELDQFELVAITRATSQLGIVDQQAVDFAIADFNHRLTAADPISGDAALAEFLITNALPPETAKRVLAETFRSEKSPFEQLMDLPTEQIVEFAKRESPITIAFLLRNMKGDTVPSVLAHFDDRSIKAIILHMLNPTEPGPAVKEAFAAEILKYVSACQTSTRSESDISTVSDILNAIPPENARIILEHLETVEPKTAARIQQKLLSFTQCDEVEHAELRKAFEFVTPEIIALALRGMPDAFSEHMLGALGARARRMVEQEMVAETTAGAKDIEVARKTIVTAILRVRNPL